MGAGQISFGPFVLDRSAQTLLSGGKPVALGQRALALLDALAAVDGPVDKSALIEAAWPGTIVEDGNLTVQIAALRKALGTRPDGQEWIITVPRVGYRMLRGDQASPHAAASVPLMIVLPFHNVGGNPEQDYFADGIVDDLITALSRFRTFAVLGRSASFAYRNRSVDTRQIAAELGVSYVLEGSVRRAGDRLRISAQFADGSSGASLWAQQFDGTAEDVFDFQDRIAEGIVGIVEPHIHLAELDRGRRERTGNATAYDLYLRALHLYRGFRAPTDADAVMALGLAEQAIALEPDNPRYLAMAGELLQHRFSMGWPPLGPDDDQRARSFIDRAIDNAGDDFGVIAQTGNVLLQRFKEYDRGLAMVRAAVAGNPLNANVITWAGIAETHCGNIDVALDYFHRAARLNPRGAGAALAHTGLAHVHIVRGENEEALRWAASSYALTPTYDCGLWMLAAANAHLGRMEDARRYCAELRKLAPNVTVSSIRAGQPAKIPQRIEPVLAGLKLAGLPE
jgi:TolB-like protein